MKDSPSPSLARERLRLQLEAAGREGLLPLLEAAQGQVLAGRFDVGAPFAAGGQAMLFEGTDRASGAPVLIKQPSFDYRRPIQHGRRDAAARRETLRVEHQVLSACDTGHLPRPLALLQAPALVPAARDFNPLATETYLVIERIEAVTIEQAALTVWPAHTPAQREAWARRLAGDYLGFWQALRDKGFFYGDTNARNLLIEQGSGRLRVVDAACVSVVGDEPTVALREAAPAFLTPRLLEAAQAGTRVAADASTMLPVLAKVLHFALSRDEPLNGALPALDTPAMAAYSEDCRQALRTMLQAEQGDAPLPLTLERLRAWLR